MKENIFVFTFFFFKCFVKVYLTQISFQKTGQKNIPPASTVLDTPLFVEDVVLTKILDTDSMDSK